MVVFHKEEPLHVDDLPIPSKPAISNTCFTPVTNARARADRTDRSSIAAKGIYVYDDQGKQYIEALAGLWSVAVGFGEERLVEPPTSRCASCPTTIPSRTNRIEPSIDARRAAGEDDAEAASPARFFTNSGSEANDTVVKMVWYYNNALGRPQKKKIHLAPARLSRHHHRRGSLTGLPTNHRDFDLPIDRFQHVTCPHYWRFGQPGESEEAFRHAPRQELERPILRGGARHGRRLHRRTADGRRRRPAAAAHLLAEGAGGLPQV